MRRRPGAVRPAAPGPPVLPSLYAPWIADLLGGPVEPETNATCADCAMCAPPGAPPDPGGLYFDPKVKCCSFWPILPNFLVGRILRDLDPTRARGRASVDARISAGLAVTPLGLGRPEAQSCPEEAFGRDERFRCPHFTPDGTCGIWPHRESTCATFFCKFVRGAVGAEFWSALQRLLEAVEQVLARHCLERLDARDDDWGRWTGRERAFYEAAADVVEPLSWPDVLERGGPELGLHVERARSAHARLRAPAIPPGPLRLGTFVVTGSGPDAVRLVSYRDTDPLVVPRDLFDVLPAFEGRSAAQAIAAIGAAHALDIEPAVVGRLADLGVLAAAHASPGDGQPPRPACPG